MSRQFLKGKELKLLISDKEAKELFGWANKLSPTLAKKVKSAVACPCLDILEVLFSGTHFIIMNVI